MAKPKAPVDGTLRFIAKKKTKNPPKNKRRKAYRGQGKP
jgi:hypothetical protein